MISKTFEIPPTKLKDGFGRSVGQCTKYVKIALWKAGYGPATTEIGPLVSPARLMGPALIAAGFKDITSEIPDGRWAAPGDVIVYKRKGEPTESGHIDIRTYNGYISDFFGTYLPTSKFIVTGIYRKYHDPLPVKRMLAFLKVFREWECHEEKDDSKRYYLMLNAINGSRRFTDVTTHPFEDKGFKGDTPAGGYQINLMTYKDFIGDRYGIGKGFSPGMQDRLAVAIMETTIKRDDQNSALGRVREGNIEGAVKMLAGRWASLPTGTQKRIGKPGNPKYVFTLEDLIQAYEKNLAEL
jgi:muramidase (phage lysozyme)